MQIFLKKSPPPGRDLFNKIINPCKNTKMCNILKIYKLQEMGSRAEISDIERLIESAILQDKKSLRRTSILEKLSNNKYL